MSSHLDKGYWYRGKSQCYYCKKFEHVKKDSCKKIKHQAKFI